MIKVARQSILRAMSDFFPRDRGGEGACSNSDTGYKENGINFTLFYDFVEVRGSTIY